MVQIDIRPFWSVLISAMIMGSLHREIFISATCPNNCVIFRTISEGPDIVLGHATNPMPSQRWLLACMHGMRVLAACVDISRGDDIETTVMLCGKTSFSRIVPPAAHTHTGTSSYVARVGGIDSDLRQRALTRTRQVIMQKHPVKNHEVSQILQKQFHCSESCLHL
jgi:hypothetical protein